MRPRKFSTEKIIVKLREAEVLISQGMDPDYLIISRFKSVICSVSRRYLIETETIIPIPRIPLEPCE